MPRSEPGQCVLVGILRQLSVTDFRNSGGVEAFTVRTLELRRAKMEILA